MDLQGPCASRGVLVVLCLDAASGFAVVLFCFAVVASVLLLLLLLLSLVCASRGVLVVLCLDAASGFAVVLFCFAVVASVLLLLLLLLSLVCASRGVLVVLCFDVASMLFNLFTFPSLFLSFMSSGPHGVRNFSGWTGRCHMATLNWETILLIGRVF